MLESLKSAIIILVLGLVDSLWCSSVYIAFERSIVHGACFLSQLLVIFVFTFDLLVQKSSAIIRQVVHALNFVLCIICLVVPEKVRIRDGVNLQCLIPVESKESECEQVEEV